MRPHQPSMYPLNFRPFKPPLFSSRGRSEEQRFLENPRSFRALSPICSYRKKKKRRAARAFSAISRPAVIEHRDRATRGWLFIQRTVCLCRDDMLDSPARPSRADRGIRGASGHAAATCEVAKIVIARRSVCNAIMPSARHTAVGVSSALSPEVMIHEIIAARLYDGRAFSRRK